MNVLMLAPDFIPSSGGVGVYISEIAKNLPDNVQIHVITPKKTQFAFHPQNEKVSVQNLLPSNVHIHYLGSANDNFLYNFSFQLNCWRRIPKFIKDHHIDLIHSQSAMPDLFISPDKIQIPIVTTIHTTIEGQLNAIKQSYTSFNELSISEKWTYLLGPSLKLIENSYYSKKRCYITVSRWGKEKISNEKKINSKNIAVIYNGVNSEIYTPDNKKLALEFFPQFCDIDSLKILYLSRFIHYKGINSLIAAIPSVLKRVDAHFIFAGIGKFPEQHLPLKNYTYLGYIHNENKPFLYSLSDVFILPSVYENFPISILEAMASQNAVIASNVGGIPEMIQPNKDGLLIPPGDPVSIATAIIEMVENDSLRERISDNARYSVINKFNWKIAAKETKKYYEKVLMNENPAGESSPSR